MRHFRKVLAVAVLSLGLAACFTADRSLIETGEAPYARIAFQADGDDEETVLTREGDGYTLPTDEGVLTLRFAPIGENLYLVEMSGEEDGETLRLIGSVRLFPDTGRAHAYRVIADDVADAGPGLRPCGEDAICIDDLDAYVTLVEADIANGVEPAASYDVTFVD